VGRGARARGRLPRPSDAPPRPARYNSSVRIPLLIITVLFLAGLAALTVYDISSNGVTPLDVVSVIIIAFFGVAIVGALATRPPEDPSDL
jgi:hypothetical protein